MKYLLVIVVLFVVLWLWRSGRGGPQTPPRRGNASPPPPRLEMVRCRVCGVHLPEADAVRADSVYYCSVEHLNQAIGRQP